MKIKHVYFLLFLIVQYNRAAEVQLVLFVMLKTESYSLSQRFNQ